MLSQEQLAVALKAFGEALPVGTKLHSLKVTPSVGYSDTQAKPVFAFVLAETDEDFQRFSQVIERGIEACESEVGLTSALLREKMKFKTTSGAELETDLSEARHTIILGGDAEMSRFNPLEAARNAPEFMVQLLEQSAGIKLDDEKKKVVLSILADLPEGATMRDLYEAIKVEEAASIGIKPEQYEALAPLFEALRRMQAEGVHAGLFDQRADV